MNFIVLLYIIIAVGLSEMIAFLIIIVSGQEWKRFREKLNFTQKQMRG